MKTNKSAYKITGIALIAMALTAIYAYGIAISSLYVAGDVTETAARIAAEPIKMQLGTLSWIVILLLDIVVALGLYQILKDSSLKLALWTAGLRGLYGAVLVFGIVSLFRENISGFIQLWQLGLIVFGVHLVILGTALLKRSHAPRWLAILLIVAGIAYALIHSLNSFAPELQTVAKSLESILMAPMALAELALAIWLLVVKPKGLKA